MTNSESYNVYKDSNKVFFFTATEENGFEPNFLGAYDTKKIARKQLAYVIKDDIETGVLDDCAMESLGESSWTGQDYRGYVVGYFIGTESECMSAIDNMRAEFYENDEDD